MDTMLVGDRFKALAYKYGKEEGERRWTEAYTIIM